MISSWQKSYDKPRQYVESRDITLLIKVQIIKALVFPVVTYDCKSWTIEETECERTDAFKLWCWRRLLKVTWTTRRSNQSTLREIKPRYSLEVLMLKLKLRYFGHLMQIVDSLEKFWCWERLKAEGMEGILAFWMLSLHPTFSLSSFTFIKRLFSSSSLCHKGGVICISEVIDISPSNLDSSLCFLQPNVSHDLLCI